MPLCKVLVQIEPKRHFPANSDIILSEKTMKQLKIPVLHPVQFRFGGFQQPVRVIDQPDKTNKAKSILLCESLAQSCGLQTGDTLHLKYEPMQGSLRLGPVLSIISDRTYPQHPMGKKFGLNTAFYEEISKVAQKEGAFIYIFTPQSLEKQSTTIEGWRWNGSTWSLKRFPLPDVLYNRLSKRKLEQLERVQALFKQKGQWPGFHVFNEHFLNKNDVSTIVDRASDIRTLQPETHILRDFSRLAALFQRHSVLFLKPSTGSMGRGIIRLSRVNGAYQYQLNTINGTVRHEFKSFNDLIKYLKPRIRRTTYLVQQGIPLLRIDGRQLDFRALVQRNDKGQWAVTSIVARIANSASIVSNVAGGGTMSRVKDALERSNLPHSKIPEVMNQLRSAALSIASTIEQHVDGLFAELGIDLAVDPTGRVWLIEVNSKPSKTEDTALTEGKIRPSVKQLIKYIFHLSKFEG